MDEPAQRKAGLMRTIVGLALILGAAPVFLWLIPGHEGWTVILGGVAALAALVAGILLAGGWLGVFRRRRQEGIEQQGCQQIVVTLLALLAGAVILYYVVYYGAGAYLRGELSVLLLPSVVWKSRTPRARAGGASLLAPASSRNS